jgi:mono/diheme cytochrome c family protein
VAARLGSSTEYAWAPTLYGRRAVRATLLAERCDAFFGLPADPDFMRSVALTRPFLDVGYAIVAPRSLALARWEDLRGKRVAVQFSSPPQLLLSTRTDLQAVTFRQAEEAVDALGRGEAEAAFVWGPIAGWVNRGKLGGAFRVVPVAGAGLQWRVAVGVRQGQHDLRARLDAALAALEAETRQLADKYGFPRAAPVDLDAPAADMPPGAGRDARAMPRGGPPGGAPVIPPGPRPDGARAIPPGERPDGAGADVNPFTGDASVIAVGRRAFNEHCAHCHAPNALSPEPSRDLRRLRLRYGERLTEVAFTTITAGRPDKGMPPWREMLAVDVIWKIVTFLESVQREP